MKASQHEYLQKCSQNQLQNQKKGRPLNVRDLLMSRTAMRHESDKEKIEKAFDALIGLENHLINRMLEIAALAMYQANLSIFITDLSEISELRLGNDPHGFFNPNIGLIVCSSNIDRLETSLIHELAHAVNHIVFQSHNLNRGRFFTETFHRECTQFNRPSKDITRYDDIKFKLFLAITQAGYPNAEQEGEFIPCFLEHFVDASYTMEALAPDGSSITPSFVGVEKWHYSYILRNMCDLLPRTSTELFRNHFKKGIDRYWREKVCPEFEHIGLEHLNNSEFYEGVLYQELSIKKIY